MTERTLIVSVHPFRRTARKRERQIQQAFADDTAAGRYFRLDVPAWANGVRVEKAGPLSYAVVATSHKGH